MSEVLGISGLANEDLEEVVRGFPSILDTLRQAYEELEERAASVEHELSLANRELERLHSLDKMAALGTMAAGIAHEIRNPLNAVKGFASLIRRAVTDETHRRWATSIVDGVAEADAIIENILSFGSPEPLRLETIDGKELARDAADLARSEHEGRPSVTTSADTPAFVGDRIKLRQALRNLIANAGEAGAKSVAVEIERVGDELVLRVSDDGPGIPAELHSRILDPFFTTRPEGSGLGLALVSTIVQLHGGTVQVHPETSHLGGSEIRVHIPFQPASVPAVSPQNPEHE